MNRKSKKLNFMVDWIKALVMGYSLILSSSITLADAADVGAAQSGKPMIYQVMTRLFGNDHAVNRPWGTRQQNGVGKFNDFTPQALAAIKAYGTTHIWYTGVPHHAVIADYTRYGISQDDPDVVKGRAGSPYAVKDYYNVNPDLATDPAQRLAEFDALIKRTHQAGMKVIIDIVPNHVARRYESISRPEGINDLGAEDDTSLEYHRDNNFYYIQGEDFRVPILPDGVKPLNGEVHPLADGKFEESPAKWTGNGARRAQPKHDDWFETVKVNYGVKPDGSYDFDLLPDGYAKLSTEAHYDFWKHRDVPDSWIKFRDIALYWIAKGVDGFRYDMAEMVPVEFWSYLNSHIKHYKQETLLLAEVYNRDLYRDYLKLGRMDYLYDKVDLYDGLKAVMQNKEGTSSLLPLIESVADIESQMLHFLENHDEQRIASPEFAGDAQKGRPAMAISALMGRGANMLYFGQALGEAGAEDAGWGQASRTTIFDYWGIESIQNWRNGERYDGGKLNDQQHQLQGFYRDLLQISVTEPVLAENYTDLHQFNLDLKGRNGAKQYHDRLFSFARWGRSGEMLVIVNFEPRAQTVNLSLPSTLAQRWKLASSSHWQELLTQRTYEISGDGEVFTISLTIPANGVVILRRQSE